jgi:hypothetical protein
MRFGRNLDPCKKKKNSCHSGFKQLSQYPHRSGEEARATNKSHSQYRWSLIRVWNGYFTTVSLIYYYCVMPLSKVQFLKICNFQWHSVSSIVKIIKHENLSYLRLEDSNKLHEEDIMIRCPLDLTWLWLHSPWTCWMKCISANYRNMHLLKQWLLCHVKYLSAFLICIPRHL